MAHTKGIESTGKLPKTNPSAQSAPRPGSYSGGSVEQAANRVEATPGSKSPSTYGNNNQVTSSRPAPRGPFQSTSDNARAKELLKSENPARNAKPDIMRG